MAVPSLRLDIELELEGAEQGGFAVRGFTLVARSLSLSFSPGERTSGVSTT